MSENNISTLHVKSRPSAGLTVSDLVKELQQNIATGYVRADCKAILFVLNRKGEAFYREAYGSEEPYVVTTFRYGLSSDEQVCMIECAKFDAMRAMGYGESEDD